MPDGGMGALYLACRGDVGLEKLCVIKTVLPRADKEYRARFRDEAKVVVRLSHGNLVPVFDAGVVGDELYLAMEYVDGKDLRSVWNRCAQKGIAFPVEVAVYIARELSRGLHHAHTSESIKLVHRDVSPPNVLVSFFGEVKLTDFGLASSTLKTEKTQAGVVYGKISYMSPEQAKGEPLDGRTDQYAVAVMLWELLTGRQLFSSKDPDVVQRVRDPEVLPPSQVAPRVEPALDVIVCKALAKERTLRYADCEAFRAALSGYLAHTAPTLDNAGVAEFLHRLFGDEIVDQRKERQRLLSDLSGRVRALQTNIANDQTVSQPNTVDMSPPDHSHGHLIGSLLDGRYLVKRLIGEGGMGLVYEAEHVDIGRRVAVKVLHAAFTRHAEVVSRFRSEARAATRIGHPHIVDVFDSGTTVDGAVYFVMEFLSGKDLGELVRLEKTLAVRRTITLAREICQALAAAHKAGIIHRDMKPENVFLVDRDGQTDFVKVLDFGIAKTVEGITDRVGRLTTPGMAMGTPEYMAPEQAAGHQADPRVDVYAVGAIMYEMLTGRPPHEGATIIEVLTKKATEAPVPIENLRPDVPRELARLTMRALALSPDERPQSMDKLAEELGRLSGAGAEPVPFSGRGSAKIRARPIGVAVGILVSAIALVAVAGVWGGRAFRSRGDSTGNPKVALPMVNPVKAATPTPTAIKVTPAVTHIESPPTLAAKKDRPATPAKPAIALDAGHVQHHADTDDTKRTIAEAQAALDSGRYAQAKLLFSGADQRGAAHGAAKLGLGHVAFAMADYPEAAHWAERAVHAGAGKPGQMLLANSYYRLHRYDDAIKQYKMVLATNSSDSEAKRNLAAAERLRGSD